MNEPVKFPVFIVMRNGHIMPPGLLLHEANAAEVAKREEGEIVALYAAPQGWQQGAAFDIVETFIYSIPGETDATRIERTKQIEAILTRHQEGK